MVLYSEVTYDLISELTYVVLSDDDIKQTCIKHVPVGAFYTMCRSKNMLTGY